MAIPGSQLIAELRKGGCSIALGEALDAATDRVKATGKAAKVSLTITIAPVDKEAADVERVFLTDEIKMTLPKLPQKNTLFFVGERGELTRKDPSGFIKEVKDVKDAAASA